MKPRTVTLRIELQTARSIKELRSLADINVSASEDLMYRKGKSHPDGEIVQVSVDVAQPAKQGGARVPKRKAVTR